VKQGLFRKFFVGDTLERIRQPFAQRLSLRLHPDAAPYDLSRAALRVLREAGAME
jgi:hypothetical protein